MPTIVERIEAMFEGRPWGLLPPRPKFDAQSYPARVRYAAWCLCEWEDHRNFDTCFEMYDGAYVVAALVRAAQGRAGYLHHRLSTDDGGMWAQWQGTAARLAHIADADLQSQAAAHRRYERERGSYGLGQACGEGAGGQMRLL